jgi:NitT/TauT family transport system ATP-binding protein
MAARPGRIREIIPIELPYPREAATKTSPEFIKIRARIDRVVREEFQKLRQNDAA